MKKWTNDDSFNNGTAKCTCLSTVEDHYHYNLQACLFKVGAKKMYFLMFTNLASSTLTNPDSKH